jgi:hypothetical protein
MNTSTTVANVPDQNPQGQMPKASELLDKLMKDAGVDVNGLVVTSTETMSGIVKAVIILLVFGALAFAVWIASTTQVENSKSGDAAAVTAMVLAVSIGIERITEFGWTVIGSLGILGTWWPFNLVKKVAEAGVEYLDLQLKPVWEQAAVAIEKLKDVKAPEELDALRKTLKASMLQIEQFKKLAPGNQRLDALTTTAFQSLNYLDVTLSDPQLQRYVNAANQAIAGISDLVNSFKDNPGRRLLSILTGVYLGLAIAWFLGLDIFSALGVTFTNPSVPAGVGIALTGIVVGLGSSPTHEVIRVIQETKKARKVENSPSPSVGETPMATLASTANSNADLLKEFRAIQSDGEVLPAAFQSALDRVEKMTLPVVPPAAQSMIVQAKPRTQNLRR